MTNYAGKSSTLNAVATTADRVIDGYMSAIEASQGFYSPLPVLCVVNSLHEFELKTI